MPVQSARGRRRTEGARLALRAREAGTDVLGSATAVIAEHLQEGWRLADTAPWDAPGHFTTTVASTAAARMTRVVLARGGAARFGAGLAQATQTAPAAESFANTDGTARMIVHFGADCQGPPLFVHGGCVAAIMDEVMGIAIGTTAMTARLELNYMAPLPLGSTVVFEATLEPAEGRKQWVQFRAFELPKPGQDLGREGVRGEGQRVFQDGRGLFVLSESGGVPGMHSQARL